MTSLPTSCKFVALLFTACMSLVSAQNTTQTPSSTSAPCPTLTNPENGNVTTSGNSAVYTCLSGFQLSSGDQEFTRMCQNGTWEGMEPVCDPTPTVAPPAMSSTASAMDGGASTAGSTPTTPRAGMASTMAPGMGSTAAAMSTKDMGDMDNNMDKDHEDNDGNGGGLNNSQIALAVLATILIVFAIAFFSGLLYWKYRGTSYVEVSANY